MLAILRKFLRYVAYKLGISLDDVNHVEIIEMIGLINLKDRQTIKTEFELLHKMINSDVSCSSLLERVNFSVPSRTIKTYQYFS